MKFKWKTHRDWTGERVYHLQGGDFEKLAVVYKDHKGLWQYRSDYILNSTTTAENSAVGFRGFDSMRAAKSSAESSIKKWMEDKG